MIGVETNIPGFADHWATQLGASPLSLERLRGGINNQVFRCSHGSQQWVIKGYAPTQLGHRDRMQAEVEFLQFAAESAPGFTPALIQFDRKWRCVVLEHLEGEAFPEGAPPSDAAVAEAVEFFRQLNAETCLARHSIKADAAEGFLSLREHLTNVRERYERMTCSHLVSEIRPRADALLNHLHTELAYTEERTNSLIDRGIVEDTINTDQRCISPSDFGFHNAIRTPKGIRFIDFEFAGWDDPAKAVQDFILQPRVPIAKDESPLLEAFPHQRRPGIRRRCEAIRPITKLKWVCIVLGVLQPERLEEILSVIPEAKSKTLIQNRIEKAEHYLSQIN